MAAFLGEFAFELIRVVLMIGVITGAVIGGKKFRDYKDSKKIAEEK